MIEYITYDVSGAYKPKDAVTSNLSIKTKGNWSVYPVPAKDELHINGELAGVKIRLIDSQGNVIKLFDGSNLKGNTISLSGMVSGLYCLNIYDQNQSSVLRFIVE